MTIGHTFGRVAKLKLRRKINKFGGLHSGDNRARSVHGARKPRYKDHR